MVTASVPVPLPSLAFSQWVRYPTTPTSALLMPTSKYPAHAVAVWPMCLPPIMLIRMVMASERVARSRVSPVACLLVPLPTTRISALLMPTSKHPVHAVAAWPMYPLPTMLTRMVMASEPVTRSRVSPAACLLVPLPTTPISALRMPTSKYPAHAVAAWPMCLLPTMLTRMVMASVTSTTAKPVSLASCLRAS